MRASERDDHCVRQAIILPSTHYTADDCICRRNFDQQGNCTAVELVSWVDLEIVYNMRLYCRWHSSVQRSLSRFTNQWQTKDLFWCCINVIDWIIILLKWCLEWGCRHDFWASLKLCARSYSRSYTTYGSSRDDIVQVFAKTKPRHAGPALEFRGPKQKREKNWRVLEIFLKVRTNIKT